MKSKNYILLQIRELLVERHAYTPERAEEYINKHKEYSEIFTKYSDRGAWHAIERIDPEGYAQWNWDYVTVDAYPSASVARKNVNKVPKKIRNKMLEKYGTGPEQRTIRERFVGLLLAKAN